MVSRASVARAMAPAQGRGGVANGYTLRFEVVSPRGPVPLPAYRG